MRLRFKYTFSDYLWANIAHKRRTAFKKAYDTIFAWFVSPLIMIVCVVYLIRLPFSDVESATNLVYFCALLLIFLILSPLGLVLMSALNWRRMPSLRQEIEWIVDEEGIEITATTSKAQLGWQAFNRFLESKRLFLLYSGDRMFYMAPKRLFENESDIARFREIAQAKVPGKR